MKLRIEPDHMCFRLDFAELEQLVLAGTLCQSLSLPDGLLTYEVHCLPAGSSAKFRAKDNHFSLSIAQDVIEAHKASLPSLNGIMHDFPTYDGKKITVSFEINLQKKHKR